MLIIRWDLTAISTRVQQIAIPNEMANEEAPISLSREVHHKLSMIKYWNWVRKEEEEIKEETEDSELNTIYIIIIFR